MSTYNVTLGELIKTLEAEPHKTRTVEFGFSSAVSYRGYYEQVAFQPCDEATIEELLTSARHALGNTFDGYKGGKYTMTADTECWIASYGEIGWPLTRDLLAFILGEVPKR